MSVCPECGAESGPADLTCSVCGAMLIGAWTPEQASGAFAAVAPKVASEAPEPAPSAEPEATQPEPETDEGPTHPRHFHQPNREPEGDEDHSVGLALGLRRDRVVPLPLDQVGPKESVREQVSVDALRGPGETSRRQQQERSGRQDG